MTDQRPANAKRRRVFRLVGLLVVFFGVAISWIILAKYILHIEPEYWIRVPMYLLLIVFYWVPAWGAIASRMEDVPGTRERWVQGAGCLFVALVVFLLICLLLAILFLR